ncbi:MAG TPA: PASTA domain-containing protein [Solirubrobacterales bacterium]|jgi:hypothetical protein
MKAKWAALLAGGVMAIPLIATANAGAATVTLGSPLTSNFIALEAQGVGTSAMIAGPGIVSPVDGTVISWRGQEFSGGPFRLRVLKLAPLNRASGDGTGPPLMANGGRTEQAVNLPIHQGEVVGFDNGAPTDEVGAVGAGTPYTVEGWSPPLADGGSPRGSFVQSGPEYAYNATVRYCLVPNVIGMKLGAARQALASADCTLGSVTQKKFKKKKGKKKPKGPKIVKSQSAPGGTSLGDQAPVNVHVKVKPKKKKHQKHKKK